MNVQEFKAALRQSIKKQRSALTEAEHHLLSTAIVNHLWDLIQEKQVKKLHTFLPIRKEVNIYPLIEKALDAGIEVYVPKTLLNRQTEQYRLEDLNDLEVGIFGTKHPKNQAIYHGTFDLIIVPGLGFDLQGNRLGYGAGHYDVFLAEYPSAFKVGICFPFQVVDALPSEPHDIRMDKVVFA